MATSSGLQSIRPGPAQTSRLGSGIAVTEAFLLSALTTTLIFGLQWRYGFNWGDEGLMWYISQRTTLGQIPLRDFFSYDPGRYYWSAFFFKTLHGSGLFEQIVADAAFGIVALAIAYLALTRVAVTRPWRIGTLLTLAIMLGFPRHKIFEQGLSLFCVAGLAFVMAKPDAQKRWFAYGVATGLAAFVGRNSGIYFFVAGVMLIFVLQLSRAQFGIRPAFAFCGAGIAAGYSPMLLMLCFIRDFASAFYQSLLFTAQWQHKLPIPFPWHVHLGGLAPIDALQARAVSVLCLLVPGTYVFGIWTWFKKNRDQTLQLACAASLAGLCFLHHAFDRADFFHIAQGIVPFAIVVGALSSYFWKISRRTSGIAFSAGALALILLAWLPYEPAIQFLRLRPDAVRQVEIASKRFYVEAQQAQVMLTTQEDFRACGAVDETFLQAPYYPGLYPYLRTRAPFWELYYLYPRDGAFQQRHIEALQRNQVSLILLNRTAAVDGLDALRIQQTYPELVEYVLTHYRNSAMRLPDGFELYYSPEQCPNLR